jgi:two-component system sensor histidine kinase PilS (NtrC family)
MRQLSTVRNAIVGRLVVAAVVIGVASIGRNEFNLAPVLVLGAAVLLLSGGFYFWHSWGRWRHGIRPVQLASDIALVTLLVYFSGGGGSPFKLLYFLPVIAAASALGTRAGVIVAVAGLTAFVGLFLIERPDLLGQSGHHLLDEAVILSLSLILVALLVGFLGTRTRESEQKLEETRSELARAQIDAENIVESIRSGLVLVDSEGVLIHLNRAGRRILGVPSLATRGRDFREVLSAVPAFSKHIAAALGEQRSETRVELSVTRPDGSKVPVGLSTSVLRDNDGKERGAIAIFQDLTDVRELERRMRHADRLAALGEFAAGLAHEIRNPLNAIRGSVEMIGEGVDRGSDDAKLVELVLKESDRLSNLVQGVLRYGRVEEGVVGRVDLGELAHEVSLLARNHSSYRSEIALDVDCRGASVRGNPEQIRQILLNLIINAFEAIEGSGRVKVFLLPVSEMNSEVRRGEMAVVVEDTGCGIEAERVDQVFAPFVTSKARGTGLGLAVVDKLVELQDGRIVIESKKDRGSRFIVYLPGVGD